MNVFLLFSYGPKTFYHLDHARRLPRTVPAASHLSTIAICAKDDIRFPSTFTQRQQDVLRNSG